VRVVQNLRAKAFALSLFDRSDEVTEGRQETIAEAGFPTLFAWRLPRPGAFAEYAEDRRTLPGGDSTLALERRGDEGQQE
jgi:hypothetical protein